MSAKTSRQTVRMLNKLLRMHYGRVAAYGSLLSHTTLTDPAVGALLNRTISESQHFALELAEEITRLKGKPKASLVTVERVIVGLLIFFTRSGPFQSRLIMSLFELIENRLRDIYQKASVHHVISLPVRKLVLRQVRAFDCGSEMLTTYKVMTSEKLNQENNTI
jgi:hypothetical protein